MSECALKDIAAKAWLCGAQAQSLARASCGVTWTGATSIPSAAASLLPAWSFRTAIRPQVRAVPSHLKRRLGSSEALDPPMHQRKRAFNRVCLDWCVTLVVPMEQDRAAGRCCRPRLRPLEQVRAELDARKHCCR
eukprot:1408653-Rhodomonas_salina.8